MENKNLDMIMKEISSNLSGDPQKDISYLEDVLKNMKNIRFTKRL